MNKKKKTHIILGLASLIFLYFFICLLLYFFEPISYHAPDLSLSQFSFDLYKKFDYAKNDQFYIKQITHNDIVAVPEDERLKYVDDTIIMIGATDVSFFDMTTLLDSYDGEIVGFIDVIDFFQVTFSDSSYDELKNICAELCNNNMVKYAMVDYFEETPVSETSSEFSDDYSYYYLNMIDAIKAWKLSKDVTENVNVGVFDVPVYSDHVQLNVINKNEYSNDILNNELIKSSASHGTHVAGIISASSSDEMSGIYPNSVIYSENSINNAISYWVAAITNMIVNNDVKAINISMGYNSYIPVSASLGCESTIEYVLNENEFFEACLSNLLYKGYEFLICMSAGNENGTTLYRTISPVFSFGEKDNLRKLDIFGLFDTAPEYCDAKYQLCFSAIDDAQVRDRIIIVASCDYSEAISDFSSLGDAVDIVAPGENIYSTGHNLFYEYMSGTSMAAPFVTGSAALLFAIDDTLTGSNVKDILINSASEYVNAHEFNYPILNVGNAVEYVINN